MSLLSQIRLEQSMWFQYVNSKRSQFRKRIKKYNNQSKNKINITFVAEVIDTMISSSYTDLLTVKFISRDGFFAKDKAEWITYIARYDQKDMEYDQMYYQKEQDRYNFGVSIRLQNWWSQAKVAPKFTVINPLSAIPDPKPSQTWSYSINNYKFIWFVMRSSIYELKASWLYNKDWLNRIVKDYYDAQEQLDRQAYNEAYNTQEPTIETITENFTVDIYHHFTIHKGKKWLVTTDINMNTVLRQVELKAVTEAEKKNPLLVPRPVALNYWKPQRWNFFGESVRDYLEDKQDAMNIFANLAVATAKKEALWGRFLWNSRLIKNKEDILKPSVETQHFWIDETQLQPWESIANAGIELPQPAIKNDVMWMYNFLEWAWHKAVAIDSLQRWIMPDKSMTKAEAQQLQANANLWLVRNRRVDSRGDKDFRYLRWRSYIEYLAPWDKKLVVLDDDFETNTEIFDKDTFKYKKDPQIEVWTAQDLDAIDEKRKQFLSIYLPQVMADPNKPLLQKNMYEREFLRLQWYSKNQINVKVPLTPDEMIMVNDYIPMLNADIVPEWIFERLEDMFTGYIYTQLAQDTKAKKVMIETFKKILSKNDMQDASQMMSQGADAGMNNSAANIQMSQWVQQAQWENLTTRWNLQTNAQ